MKSKRRNIDYWSLKMPKKLHEKLKRQADKKGLTGEARRRYIYGTLQRIEEKIKKKSKNRR